MSKQSILKRLAGAIGSVTHGENSAADLARARSAAEAALATAERQHRKAALEAHEGTPGAAQKLMEASGALRTAQENVRDVMAAQIELEAENAERQRQARMATEAAVDETTKEEMEVLCARAERLQEAIGPLVQAWNDYTEAHSRTADLQHRNPRIRRDVGLGHGVDTLFASEIARVGQPGNLPPGHAGYFAGNYDPRALKPFASTVREFADAVRADLAKAAAKRSAAQ